MDPRFREDDGEGTASAGAASLFDQPAGRICIELDKRRAMKWGWPRFSALNFLLRPQKAYSIRRNGKHMKLC